MQELRYTDPWGRTTIFSPSVRPYVLESVTGIDGSDARLQTVSPVGMHGAVYSGNRIEDREITLTLHIHGKDRREMYELKQELLTLTSPSLSSAGEMGRVDYLNNHGHWWIPAVVKQAPRQVASRLQNYLTMQVVFYCPHPDWRSVTASVEPFAYLGGGFKFPLTIPAITESPAGVRFGDQGYTAIMYNEGDAPAPIMITITGPATRPKVELKNTSQYIAINRELAEGDSLAISTEPGSKFVTITRAAGEKESAMEYISAGSSFFQLLPGENHLEYSSGLDTTSAKVQVSFWSRYGGV